VLGFLFAMLVFPSLDTLEMALLAAMLAPTDAALGKPIVTSPDVPASIRESLNLESGLNDGICVPIVVILLGLAVGTQIEGSTMMHMVRVVGEEIGIGLIVGLALTGVATPILHVARRHGWSSGHWADVQIVALPAACFAAAQALGGSGFIACFMGGLLFGALRERGGQDLLRGAESTGETLALVTWVAFGAGVVGQMAYRVTWSSLSYAVLSLTVIRMLPVFLCLAGTGMTAGARLFIGWFGPRGLASIVFGIMVLDEGLPGNDTLAEAVLCTVVLSIMAHGVTANPLANAFSARGRRPGQGVSGP
jgi:sodium/hydrogen antiporter